MPILLDALHCKNKGRPPLWIMRQAGRYLPEYRALREKKTLRDMFYDEDVITEVTLQPIRRFGFDAAIIFSDILLLLETMGCKVDFPSTGGVSVDSTQIAINQPQFSLQDERYFAFLSNAFSKVKKELSIPLLGFAGAPLTLAYYALREEKLFFLMQHDREALHQLLSALTEKLTGYLLFQHQIGASALQIFESAGYLLDKTQFQTFAKPYLAKLVQNLKEHGIPVILFGRGSSRFVSDLVELQPTAISFDYEMPLMKLRELVPKSIAVQGNLHPEILLGSVEEVRKNVRALLEQMGQDPGFICNLGHGILPSTPLESVYAFAQEVQSYQAASGGIEQRMASGLPPE